MVYHKAFRDDAILLMAFIMNESQCQIDGYSTSDTKLWLIENDVCLYIFNREKYWECLPYYHTESLSE